MDTEALLSGFEQALERDGFAGLTQEAIAEEAGVNRVTLYRRGVTREGLLAEATKALADGFRAASLEPLTASGNARLRLERLMAVLFTAIDAHGALLATLYDGPALLFHFRADPGAATRLTRFEYTQPFARLLRDGAADGSLASEDPEADAELLFNAASWTYLHLRRSHGWSARRARTAVERQALAFVLPAERSQVVGEGKRRKRVAP
ncbi:MAG: TetR/AcrR family transcriptional regulator [Myxococcota bacterium]